MRAAAATFDGSSTFDWAALPVEFADAVVDAAAEVAACELDEPDRTVRRRRSTGEYWRSATIWRATRAEITLLKPAADCERSGRRGYELDHAEFYPAAAVPSCRHGVAADPVCRRGSHLAKLPALPPRPRRGLPAGAGPGGAADSPAAPGGRRRRS